MGVRDVSGDATLSAFTVNHRFGFPDLPPPYVVAQVAVVEDPRVRLTTNIVDCDPDELELGQTVEVRFEKAEDKVGTVWLPVFSPGPRRGRGQSRSTRSRRRTSPSHVSPMLTKDKFEDRSAITGIGMSRDRAQTDGPPAVADHRRLPGRRGRRRPDIRRHRRAVNLSRAGHRRVWAKAGSPRWKARWVFDPTWINGGMDTFGPGRLGHRRDDGSRHRDGAPRAVLPHAVGVDLPGVDARRARCRRQAAPAPASWQMPFGATSAAHTFALNAQRHFDRYGTTRETLGWIALNQRANAALNPTAIYRDPMTMDDYLTARTITTPVRPVRLRRAVRRSRRGDRVGRRRRPRHAQASQCCSRRWAPRSSSAPTGTRPR